MKKFLALVMAMMMVLAMGTVAFAESYEDMPTVTVTKTYKETNDGSTSPAETFSFTALTCTKVEDAGVGITAANAPVPTIGTVSYNAGDAGSANATKDITITLPTYTNVGIYTYTFSEVAGNTAGVTYYGETITLVVTVIEQDGQIRVAAVHTEDEGEAKSDDFDNEYSAGTLAVKKIVTGTLGDRTKEFTVKVTFTAPEGKTVKEDITYNDTQATSNVAVAAGEGWTGSKEVTITLKSDETITFTNIPYGVTYTVVEDDYSAEEYKTSYNFSDTAKKVDTASDNVEITNHKDGVIDTGILLDNAPYMMIMAMVVLAGVAMMMKRRAY